MTSEEILSAACRPMYYVDPSNCDMATSPPGLEGFGSVRVLTSGGSGEWLVLPPVKLYTVSFIIKSGKVTQSAKLSTWCTD